jgi:lysozyme
MKLSYLPILALAAALPASTWAANSVVNMSHYDLMRPDFITMKNEGIIGVIHEATYPRYDRDSRYRQRQDEAIRAGLLWGAYHFGDATDPIRQADHFLSVVASANPTIGTLPDSERKRPGVLLVLDFEKNGHYPGGSMSVSQAAAFVQRIKEKTGSYPGLYCSEYRLRQMLYGPGASAGHRSVLSNCWLWIANYHFQPRNTSPWSHWQLWQYTGDGKCDLRPREMYPKSIANMRKAERNIFNGNNTALAAFWRANAWYP